MINKNKFDEFVNSTEEKKENKIDWNERLKTWKDNLNELYKNVEEWLNEYVENGKISLHYKEI